MGNNKIMTKEERTHLWLSGDQYSSKRRIKLKDMFLYQGGTTMYNIWANGMDNLDLNRFIIDEKNGYIIPNDDDLEPGIGTCYYLTGGKYWVHGHNYFGFFDKEPNI